MGAKERRQSIEELLEYMELPERKRVFIKHLAGGLKRRVIIARALMHQPKILSSNSRNREIRV